MVIAVGCNAAAPDNDSAVAAPPAAAVGRERDLALADLSDEHGAAAEKEAEEEEEGWAFQRHHLWDQ